MNDGDSGRPGSLVRWIAFVAGAVVACGAAFWAGSVLFAAPRLQGSSATFASAVASEGKVGSTIKLSAVARWERSSTAINRANGTVTSVSVADGDTVDAGSVVYSVNLRPVVIAVGATPAFRAMHRGDEGPDVHQLLALLAALGYYRGDPDEKFGERAQRAVEAYQRDKGMPVDGVFALGDVIFTPTLPVRAAVDSQTLSVGETVGGGEVVISLLSPSPVFTIPVSTSQAASVPMGARVVVTGPVAEWDGAVSEIAPSDDGNAKEVNLVVRGGSGEPICGSECGVVPVARESTYPSEVVLQPVTKGIVVPTSAVRSNARGQNFIVEEDGGRRVVEVVASAEGMSVVSGLSEGSRVRLPITADAEH